MVWKIILDSIVIKRIRTGGVWGTTLAEFAGYRGKGGEVEGTTGGV